MADSLSRTFARYVAGLHYAALPPIVVDTIKASLRHALVVAIRVRDRFLALERGTVVQHLHIVSAILRRHFRREKIIAVGINLKRVMAWLTHPQPMQPYISPFAVLVSSG